MTDLEYARMPRFFRAFDKASLEAQYARNARTLWAMAAKAERTGRKVGGYTSEQLFARSAEYERLSQPA